MKRCPTCELEKPLDEFNRDRRARDGRQRVCRPCSREGVARWQRENPGAAYAKARRHKAKLRDTDGYREQTRAANLRRKFDMTIDDYDRMLEEQGGVCAICKEAERGRRLAVDHDHDTGAVRGLLCGNCNKALGGFRDRVDLLAAAARYLESGPSRDTDA